MTYTDLWVGSLDYDHETNALRKSKEYCKENRVHKRRGRLENKNKQGDKRHITRGSYHKNYKIPPTKMVWSC